MRIGWLTASDYEWTQHWRVAQGLGVSADDLLGVRDWQGYQAFGPAERAVLAATDDVVRDGAVSAESWAACQREFGADPAVLVELVTAIGAWRMVASILAQPAGPARGRRSKLAAGRAGAQGAPSVGNRHATIEKA